MPPGPTLQELIEGVRADARGENPLVQLSQASKTASELEQTTDALLAHFVDQCRRSGSSWSEISGALGVSKQAAHKRFSFDIASFDRFTNRASGVLTQSLEEAHQFGHGFVGTEHILLALFEFPEGFAARILAEAGITRSTVEAPVLALVKRGVRYEEERLPFTPRAKAALESAVGEALRLGHDYVGTEHLLLGILLDGNSVASKVLSGLGLDRDAVRAQLHERSN
jgi:Clp amino terminal domain, pathogenicity island component